LPARDHDTFFANGQFIRTGTVRVEATYTIPVERLVERVLSMSTSSSERLGDQSQLMQSAMREKLAPFATGGMIEDIVEARGWGVRARRRRLGPSASRSNPRR
jgi:hypothetical protein